jgi:sugar O-acyltransferase (sialic acid O-acetyltransferase NeuD family)
MNSSVSDRIVMLGAGGHARVLADVLRLLGTPASGYVAAQKVPLSAMLSALEYLGDDAALMAQGPRGITLVNAVGGADVGSSRRDVFDRYLHGGFSFATVVHPSAILAADAVVGEGAQIMAGAVVQPGVKIGRNSIVNTRAVLDHDVRVADHVHVATGAIIAGGVAIGDTSHIGAGAVVIQDITIGREVLVGAGAVVVSDCPDHARVAGVPARPIATSV